MNKNSILLAILFFSFVSCKKNTNGEDSMPAADQEFTTCNCLIEPGKTFADEYIRGSFNGVQLCADLKGNFQNSFDNMFIYGIIKRSTGNTYYDNVHMIRYTRDGKFMMAIFMENTHLVTKQFPYTLPRPNPEVCEIGEFQLQNQQKITANMCQNCADNNWHYAGMFFQNHLKFIADKFENGYLEGSFAGTVNTGSGRHAVVKDGRFRIMLTSIQRDIIIP